LSAYGKSEDYTYTAGTQYTRQIAYLLFAPASVNMGAEFKQSNLNDKKLGYYDIAEGKHLDNTLIADQHLLLKSAFAQSEWKVDELVFSMGLRFDNYRVKDDSGDNKDVTGNVLSPRFNLLYEIIHDLQFRAGYARGFRAPQIFDEDLHIETSGSRQVIHRNDEDLKQESSNSYSLSLNYTGHAAICQYQILVEGFYTALKDPFANEYGTPDENGVVIYTRKNAEKGAEVKGVNVEFNIAPTKNMQIQSGFTLQKSAYEEPQEFGETRFFRSPDNFGFVSLNYLPLPRFSFSATANYTGPMLVPYFGMQSDNPAEGELRTSGSFFDMGLKGAWNLDITDDVKLEINAGIKNLFNSYQKDFDTGINRDPSYIYGPLSPRLIYFGLKFGSFL
jgi:outer membrane receptor for ferrienterochelin and colicins